MESPPLSHAHNRLVAAAMSKTAARKLHATIALNVGLPSSATIKPSNMSTWTNYANAKHVINTLRPDCGPADVTFSGIGVMFINISTILLISVPSILPMRHAGVPNEYVPKRMSN